MMKIIGLTGAPGSGKDTAFTVLANTLRPEWNIQRYSFADPLRSFADELMELPTGHNFWGQELKDQTSEAFNYRTPRELLIDLGMLGRKYWPEMWVSKMVDKMFDEVPDVAVITDVRFANEARKVISLGGVIVQVKRPGYDYDPDRPSESGEAAEFARYTVNNAGTMPDFQRAMETLWWAELVGSSK